jgi:UDP-N-acetylglucosamine 1-carboxyvinyltransferase
VARREDGATGVAPAGSAPADAGAPAAATRYVVNGGRALRGEVTAAGAKNSALAIITAATLAERGETILDNVPQYSDILHLCAILRDLGAEAEWLGPSTLRVDGRGLSRTKAPYNLARKLRGSTYVVGLLLARLGEAEVALPGGCDIGSRPVDFHLKGFQALGADAWVEHGAIHARARRLVGSKVFIDRSSFGTTVNLMIAASRAHGTTVLENAAQEPEIVDLANFLTAMGVRIRGAGTKLIRIEGAPELTGTRHEIIPDRLEAGTYLCAAAITAGRVTVRGIIPEHLRTVLLKLEEAGCRLAEGADWITLEAPRRPIAVDVQTSPYPGFATDLQSPFVAVMTIADGVSVVQETIFDNRFGFTNELLRLGARIKVDRDVAVIQGVERLTGAPLEAHDIRGGAALILAGLAAEGTTEVSGAANIGRGFQDLEGKMAALGADIRLVP